MKEQLKQIHKKVKEHPFRLGDKKEWGSYHLLLKELDNEFYNCLEVYYKNKDFIGWLFIHELRSAIWHFEFEFKLRATINPKEDEKNKYGILIPEYQKKVMVVLENYIQQIHKFIETEIFEEFIIFSNYGEVWAIGQKWIKYKLNKNINRFEKIGDLK